MVPVPSRQLVLLKQLRIIRTRPVEQTPPAPKPMIVEAEAPRVHAHRKDFLPPAVTRRVPCKSAPVQQGAQGPSRPSKEV